MVEAAGGRLTDIAKRYLGGRFGFDASDRTTEEIQDLLSGRVSITPLEPKQVLEAAWNVLSRPHVEVQGRGTVP